MTSLLEFVAAGGMVEAEVADADKASGQDMQEEAMDEFIGREGHVFELALLAVVEVLERDLTALDVEDTVIGDGDAEDIASEVIEQVVDAVLGSLDVDFPIFG